MIRADTVCRRTTESVFVWNSLVSVADLKGPEMLFHSVLNFGLFWSLGWYFFKRMPVKKALLWGGRDLSGVRAIAVTPAPGLF